MTLPTWFDVRPAHRPGHDLAKFHLSGIPPEEEPELVRLIDYKDNSEAEVNVISAILYEHAQGQSLHRLANYVKSMPIEERNRVIRTYTEFRTSRRHRPGRAFEMVDYKIGRAHV